MLAPAGLVCAGLVAGAGRGAGGASEAGREARGAGAFCALGLATGCERGEGVAFAPRGALALRVATRFFFATLFFRLVARLGAARLVARRLVFAFFCAVARGLRRVVGFRRARLLGRAAMIDLLAMVKCA
jgi:hypothetical protein